MILFCGFFALSLLLCSYSFIKFSFSCWILLTMQFIFNTQSCSGYYIKKSYYKTDYRKPHLFGIRITESSVLSFCTFLTRLKIVSTQACQVLALKPASTVCCHRCISVFAFSVLMKMNFYNSQASSHMSESEVPTE